MAALRNFASRFLAEHPGLLVFSALTAISLAAYANSLSNSFHFDDFPGIVLNPAIRSLKNIPSYFTDPSTLSLFLPREWRPVLQITFALNYAAGGLNVTAFRIFNLLCHIGAAFLIFLIGRFIFRAAPAERLLNPRSSVWFAFVPAALFAVHTVNTEAVDYIWSRSSVLVAFFYLLAFYCFLRGPLSGDKRTSFVWHLAGLTSFAMGLGTKPTAITLPVILVFYEFLFLNRAQRNPFSLFFKEPGRLKKYIPVASLAGIYVLYRIGFPIIFLLVGFGRTLDQEKRSILFLKRSIVYLLTQFRAWIYYIRLFLWPDPLLPDFYGFGWSTSLGEPRVLLSIAMIAAILFFAWRARGSEPAITLFTFWFFIALFPEASFIPLSEAVTGYRAYLAYAGLSVAVSVLSLRLWIWIGRKMKIQPGDELATARLRFSCTLVVGLILIFLTAATVKRNRVWQDEESLWSDILQKDPANPKGYVNLSIRSIDRGEYEKAGKLIEKAFQTQAESPYAYLVRGYLNYLLNRDAESLSDLTKAVELAPQNPQNLFYRAELYRKMGRYEEALADYRSALGLRAFYTDARFGMAMVHVEREEIAQAAAACKKIVEIDPTDVRGYDCLGALLMEEKRFAEAVELYRAAVGRLPRNSDLWYALGAAYERSGMYREAADAFAEAGRLLKEFPEPASRKPLW